MSSSVSVSVAHLVEIFGSVDQREVFPGARLRCERVGGVEDALRHEPFGDQAVFDRRPDVPAEVELVARRVNDAHVARRYTVAASSGMPVCVCVAEGCSAIASTSSMCDT